ncbi:MAG: hypothetical protein L0H41_07505 [Microlunatus sp.]|nr:hypothetical protein [Microlunatus sp.]MDN5769717.1 hypothetical protein [Microlunatus sp.]
MSRREPSAALSRSHNGSGSQTAGTWCSADDRPPPRDRDERAGSDAPVLIGLAHGSRHAGVAAATDAVLAATGELAVVEVRAAYLDLTEPDLGTVVADLAVVGVRAAVVVPLLFTDAFHAQIDVPAAVSAAAAFSGVDLLLAPILGTGDEVADVVVNRLAAAGTAAEEPVLLYAVGSSRAAANAAVADLADRLANRRQAEVRVGFATTEPRAGEVLSDLVALGARTGTVVPLFVGPGLLLETIAATVADAGWRLADPLGTLLAPVLAQRYRAAVGATRQLR